MTRPTKVEHRDFGGGVYLLRRQVFLIGKAARRKHPLEAFVTEAEPGVQLPLEEVGVSRLDEGAEGTTNIAQKSIMVVAKADEVMKQADVSKESSDNLIKMVSKFTV